MAWVAIQPTINSIDPLSLSLLRALSLPLKLTRGNFSQINVATYENDRGIKKAAARNIQLSSTPTLHDRASAINDTSSIQS